MKEATREPEDSSGAEVLVVKIKVEQRWKGSDAEEMILYTSQIRYDDGSGGGSGCDYSFESGKQYLIYAFGPEDKLKTHACARTRLMEYAEKDVRELNKIKAEEERR